MLFQNLSALTAHGVTVTITVAAASDGNLEVILVPTSEKAGVNLVAKSFVATPQELDEEFAGIIAGYSTANLTLKQQLAQMQAAAEAQAEAAKAAAEAAKKEALAKQAAKPAKAAVAGKSDVSVSLKIKASPALMDDEDENDDGACANVTVAASSSIDASQDDEVPFTL